MAEIQTNHKDNNIKRTNRRSVNIDMTAMVDVAFLLLTFFVLTATLKEDMLLEVVMPPKMDDESARIEVLEEKVLTLILKEGDEIAYFFGADESKIDTTNYSPNGIRKVILDHLQAGSQKRRLPMCVDVGSNEPCWDPMVVIRPMANSRYKNLVDVLDELAITDAPKYAIDQAGR
ncbi:MAG: biopolymer transporter ExbD [Bacteroidota bacterium]